MERMTQNQNHEPDLGYGFSLELSNISKSFPLRDGTSLQVMDTISLKVDAGEFVSVVGPSGCGKTTLLRIADGLEPADTGVVRHGGQPIQHPTPHAAVVFQEDLLLPWRTVMRNMLLALELRDKLNDESRLFASELLNVVGLSGFESSYPHELSGGMRQRVNLARALVIDPAILLMDEPLASLDAQTRDLLQAELLRIWSSLRKTVLFVTHQIDEAVFLSDRVVVLSARPARVQEVVTIDLARPRSLSVKRSAELGAYVEHIWNLVMRENPSDHSQ